MYCYMYFIAATQWQVKTSLKYQNTVISPEVNIIKRIL